MKTKKIRSAIPIYAAAAVWLLLGLICPKMLLKGWFLMLAAVLSAAAYWGASQLFPGRVIEVREHADSGDAKLDGLIEEGRHRLDNLIVANKAISNADISLNLDRMVSAGEEIYRLLEKDTSKAEAVRKFMNYYLPTADKLMASYRMMMESENRGENITQAMHSIENSLGMIADAFEKQLNNLYADRKLDIETDIDVLETMLAGDGLLKQQMKQK